MKKSTAFSIWAHIFAALILILPAAGARAATPYQPTCSDPALEPWRWRSFPELKGLGLRCMAEDRDGDMWFGTAQGGRRYNGVNWTVYAPEAGLPGAPVTALCAARD